MQESGSDCCRREWRNDQAASGEKPDCEVDPIYLMISWSDTLFHEHDLDVATQPEWRDIRAGNTLPWNVERLSGLKQLRRRGLSGLMRAVEEAESGGDVERPYRGRRTSAIVESCRRHELRLIERTRDIQWRADRAVEQLSGSNPEGSAYVPHNRKRASGHGPLARMRPGDGTGGLAPNVFRFSRSPKVEIEAALGNALCRAVCPCRQSVANRAASQSRHP